MVIELKNLEKVYKGENSPAVHAVNNVTLHIPSMGKHVHDGSSYMNNGLCLLYFFHSYFV